MSKKEMISDLAGFLTEKNKHMSGRELADYLNRNGQKTSYGTDYEGKRGTYKLIRDTHHSLEKEGRKKDADNVARAFTKDNDDYAY